MSKTVKINAPVDEKVKTDVGVTKQIQISDYDLDEEFIQNILEGTGNERLGSTGSLVPLDYTKASEPTGDKRKISADWLINYLQNRHRTNNYNSYQTINTSHKSYAKSIGGVSDDTEGKDSNWENWWIRSPFWRRFNVLWLVVLLCFFIVQLLTTLIALHSAIFTEEIPDPYICNSQNCQTVSRWLNNSLDINVSPCDNFYQFVCGKFNDENDDGVLTKGGQWDMNRARIEFGEQNILAVILKNVKNDKIHDQHVTFYKTCLDTRLRDEFGLSGIRKMAQDMFGDLEKADNLGQTLEDMAVNVFTALGDFGLIDMEFDGYPNVLLHLKPYNSWKLNLKDETTPKLLTELFPQLGSSNLLTEISEGVNGIKNNYNNLFAKAEKAKRKDDMCDSSRNDEPFNIKKTLDMYAGKTVELQFWIERDEFYFHGLTHCWDHSLIRSNRIKSSFAAFWMIRILMYGHRELAFSSFNELSPILKELTIYEDEVVVRSKSNEFQCFKSIERSLGYLLSQRYFETLGYDADFFQKNVEYLFRRNGEVLANYWMTLTHMDSFIRQEALKLMLRRQGDQYFFMTNAPTTFDKLFTHKEDLKLTNDHFENAFKGKQFTLRQAKKRWERLQDKRHVLMWNSFTFDLEKPHHSVAPTDSVNAIFTPVSYYLDPYLSDFLAITKAGRTVVTMREMLHAVEDYINPRNLKKKYPNYDAMFKNDASNTYCMYFDFDSKDPQKKYSFMAKSDFKTYFLKETALFGHVVTLKAAHAYNDVRSYLANADFWKLGEFQKKWVMSKKLIDFEEYTEEQLFFMSFVRHYCKQRPLKTNTKKAREYAYYVTNILSTLMQMSEFAEAWKCPLNTPMNPGDKCF